jgi:hypothetical protein
MNLSAFMNYSQTSNTVYEGTVTVSESVAALPAAPLVQGVVLKANLSNLYPILIGNSSLTTGIGFPLNPGESISLPVNNLNLVYIVSVFSTSDTLQYIGV